MSHALKQYHPVKAASAILFLMLFLSCIGILVWASGKGVSTNGPVHIAANSARVAITFNEEILVLDTQGELEERLPLAALGIPDYPIDLRLQDDGSLLVATQRPAGLYFCDSAPWRCSAVESPLFKELRRQIKVQPDADRTGVFVSDTAGGGLHWLSADGRTTRVLDAGKDFYRTNDVALDDKQRWWLADSGNRRLVILETEAGGDWTVTDELSARTDLARPGLDWPMMIAFSPTGDAWVVQQDPALERSDLLVYEAQLGAKGRIKLPEVMHPTDVARSGNGMLVTDRDGFGLVRIDIDSHAVEPFGDQRVQAMLGAASREKADAYRMRTLAVGGMALFGILMFAMAFWASPKGLRFSPQPKVPLLEPRPWPESRGGGLHWLAPDAKTEKYVRMIQWVLYGTTACMLALLGYAWYLLSRLLDDEAARQAASCVTGISEMFTVLGLFVLGIPALAYLGFRHMRNRLGSDGHYLHIKLYNSQHLTLDPARLVYTDRMLAYQNHLFPIQTGNRKPLYAEGEVETHIAPLLSHATRLGVFAMLRYQIRHREPTTIGAAFLIVTFAVVLWYTGLWRFVLSGQ